MAVTTPSVNGDVASGQTSKRAYQGTDVDVPAVPPAADPTRIEAREHGLWPQNMLLKLSAASTADVSIDKTYTCGSSDAAGDPVYVSGANTVAKADATTDTKSKVIGFIEHKPSSTTCKITYRRLVTGLSGLTAGNWVYLTNTGGFSATPGTVVKRMGTAISSTAALLYLNVSDPAPESGDWWGGKVPRIASDGVMEIGKYVDFHETDGSTADYDGRLISDSTYPLWQNSAGEHPLLAKPSFRAWLNGTAAMSTSALAVVPYNTVDWDTESDFNTSSHVYTVARAGKWLFMYSVATDYNNANTWVKYWFAKNGSAWFSLSEQHMIGTLGHPIANCGATIVSLAVNDYVSILGQAKNTLNHASGIFFAGFWVEP